MDTNSSTSMNSTTTTTTSAHLPVLNNNHTSNGGGSHQQLRKLYFKPSTTEALHLSILDRARNSTPSSYQSDQTVVNKSQTPVTPVKSTKPNSIPENDSVKQNTLKIENETVQADAVMSLTTNTNSTPSQAPASANESDLSASISVNIFASMKTLCPALNDEEEDDDDDTSTSTQSMASDNSVTEIKPPKSSGDNQPVRSSTHNEVMMITNTNTPASNSFSNIKSTTSTNPTIFMTTSGTTKNVYLSSGKTNGLKYISNINIANISSATIATSAVMPTGSSPAVILTKTPNGSIFSNNLIGSKRSGGSKRGNKEAALSNSSSSDDDDSEHSSIENSRVNTSPSNGNRLQNLLIGQNQSIMNVNRAVITPVSKYSAQSSVLNVAQYPPITPVVNSSGNHTISSNGSLSSLSSSSNQASESESSSSICSPSQSISSVLSTSVSSSSSSASQQSSPMASVSICSQKSLDQDFANSSIASPTSCCSSVSTTNESNIDLNDDTSSSTASGPIYIRQPGFDHHAHEIIHQGSSSQLPSISKQQQLASLKSFVINEPKSSSNARVHLNSISNPGGSGGSNGSNTSSHRLISQASLPGDKKSKKIGSSGSADSLLLHSSTQPANVIPSIKTNKAKKKQCLDGSSSNHLGSIYNQITNCELLVDKQHHNGSLQLKPISSKAKREALPMRLRALPASFWQQPNQPNVSPGTMYLPPLFKNENASSALVMDSITGDDETKLISLDPMQSQSSSGNNNATAQHIREVRMSAANPDLLFKLFDGVEPNGNMSDKDKQRHLSYKLYRNVNKQQSSKLSMSKALTKGEDPCILDAVSEGLFPLLRLDSSSSNILISNIKNSVSGHDLSSLISADQQTQQQMQQSTNNNNNNNNSALLMNSLSSNGLSNSSPIISSSQLISANSTLTSVNAVHFNTQSNNSIGLPALHFEQNYSQALSEVVAAL